MESGPGCSYGSATRTPTSARRTAPRPSAASRRRSRPTRQWDTYWNTRSGPKTAGRGQSRTCAARWPMKPPGNPKRPGRHGAAGRHHAFRLLPRRRVPDPRRHAQPRRRPDRVRQGAARRHPGTAPPPRSQFAASARGLVSHHQADAPLARPPCLLTPAADSRRPRSAAVTNNRQPRGAFPRNLADRTCV